MEDEMPPVLPSRQNVAPVPGMDIVPPPVATTPPVAVAPAPAVEAPELAPDSTTPTSDLAHQPEVAKPSTLSDKPAPKAKRQSTVPAAAIIIAIVLFVGLSALAYYAYSRG